MTQSPKPKTLADPNGSLPYGQQVAQPLLDLTQTQPSHPLLPPQPTDPNAIEESWSHGSRDLLETLPQLWTRGLLYLLVIFSGVVLPWAMLSKVDETGTARGRLEPKGKTNRLDAPVSGTVAAVKIKEGQTIQAGQVLMELETTVPRSDLQQAETRLEGQRNRLVQLESLKTQLETAIRTQRLQNQAQIAGQLAQVNQIQQQLRATEEQFTLTQQLLTKDQDRVVRYRDLRQQGIIPGLQVEDAERNKIETQQRAGKAQADIEQARSELKKQLSTYTKALREGELTILDSERRLQELQVEIASARTEIAQSNNQIQALKFQLQQRVITAPISGTIFQLSVKNPGSVIQSGAAVADIAPQNVPFVLRAQMPSQNSGFLQVGMLVKLKFDAYPFQDYGIVSGRVSAISPDSKVQDTPQGQIEVFELEIVLDRSYLQAGNRRIALTPGQTATAEVIVRQRRVIDYILDPFKKLQTSGLKL